MIIKERDNSIAYRWLMLLAALSLLLLAGAAMVSVRPDAPPAPVTVAACREAAETLAPAGSWRFRTDPEEAGLAAGWHEADFDDSGWARSAPGQPWEEAGYVDYDGIGWYRATFTIPQRWPEAYLGTVGVDDFARLWVNGRERPLETVTALPVGGEVQLTYRIEDVEGYGGIKKAVRVGRTVRAALPADNYVRHLAGSNPAWQLPAWVNGAYHAWTFTGVPGATEEALITAATDVAPWADAPLLSLWVQDGEGGVHVPPAATFGLEDGFLPLPRATWEAAGLAFTATLRPRPDGTGTYWQTTVRNPAGEAREATLLLLARPLAVEADWRPIYTTGFDLEGRLSLNGQPFLATAPAPDSRRSSNLAALQDALAAGRLPAGAEPGSCTPAGDGAVVMAYPLNLGAGEAYTLTVAFPGEAGQPLPDLAEAGAQATAAREMWQAALADPVLAVPDGTVMDAYRASAGYLQIALDPNGPHPGPLEHDALWTRDAAYIGATLLRLGESETVREYISSLLAYQREDGYVPAIIETGRGPRPDEEWDAQGQLIYLIGEYYRYSGDEERVRAWYPSVVSAAEFIRELREQTADDPPATRGILPPSRSAEDLGSAEWHHYWDNFWAVAGLTYGAHLAQALGQAEDAAWMAAEAEALTEALRASIEVVMGPEPAYIPNGPEDVTSSAMARGSTNALYPVEVFARTDPLVTRSFAAYYEQWIAPQDGGYKHIYGQLWPYGGLGLARDYVRLGQQGIVHQILGWTLENQTLDGTFAWAEQVNPDTGGISGGDMPHAWAASSLITLVREMLLIHNWDDVELFAGVPGSWLEAGKTVALRQAPTPFGPVTATLEGNLSRFDPAWAGTVTLAVEATATPPAGYRWRLPQRPSRIEGDAAITLDDDGWLSIPPEGGHVVLTFD